ncbi:hypothetical protein O181_016910 [Austropuccinia psidii MF-1]|uniref:RRM domain-containing protein n=1 Tax=Austropuccinia psidii MF-1 TaxID=1389203 RepID=A0A9Q3C6T8_9BASI|nr:hypothetical protein [Austropuccinia psidii MF-1]
MSQQPPTKLTKKQLKSNAFRAKKKIKDLLQDTPALPSDDEEHDGDNKLKTEAASNTKKRKRSVNQAQTNSDINEEGGEKNEADDNQLINCSSAKRRKRKKAAKIKQLEQSQAEKSSKLILFVGNLPFDITADRLKDFFSQHCDEQPMVRLMTPKLSTSQSSSHPSHSTKGCGFVEFKTSAALQKALRLHHTLLSPSEDPAKENQKKARKINIELTAGGGGKSESRQKKIEQSKARLAKQREKRLTQKMKEAAENPSVDNSDLNVSIKTSKQKKTQKITEEGPAQWKTKAEDPSGKHAREKIERKRAPQFTGANAIKLG